jgi:hypothetical protein
MQVEQVKGSADNGLPACMSGASRFDGGFIVSTTSLC